MLWLQVNERLVEHVTDCVMAQHNSGLCGARFLCLLRACCSLDGEPVVYNQTQVLSHSLKKMMNSNQNVLSSLRISSSGDVEISAPQWSATEQSYTNYQSSWINMTSFQARGTKHDGMFEKYLFDKPLRACSDNEKTLRCGILFTVVFR